MSANAVAAPTRGSRLVPLPLLGAGGLLLLRIRLLATPAATRTVLLAIVYAAILAVALLVPAARERARLRPAIVLVLGLAGFVLAGFAGGRPATASFGAPAIALSVVAAIAEEALFRRAAYGWLTRYGAVVAVAGSALLFALIHVPLYGSAAFPVDLGAGLLLSWQRRASGDWTVPAATHAAANLLAVVMR